MNDMYVIKASGEKSPFSEEKIRNSLRHSGATENQVELILDEVKSNLFDGISTREIYQIAFSLLKEDSRHLAARYHLKQAIMELGPTGFPFEKYMAELLSYQEYKVKINQIVQGHCVGHEIDIIAEKDNEYIMIECKYHNYPGISSDVKIPLYIHSRFRDVEAEWVKLPYHKGKKHKPWIITNTRFTEDAIKYATCSGIYLLGWDYPLKGSIKSQIDLLGLYPVTCLTSLSKLEKEKLLNHGVVLCLDISEKGNLLKSIGIKPDRIGIVQNEAYELCRNIKAYNK